LRWISINRVTTLPGNFTLPGTFPFFLSLYEGPPKMSDLLNNQHTANSTDDLTIRQLEDLDDIIFPAIDGDETALRHVEPVWQQTLATLGPEVVRESRQQYLRYARATWDYLKSKTLEHPHQLLAVMQIIMMLTGDDIS
jgi:hypothetical protein